MHMVFLYAVFREVKRDSFLSKFSASGPVNLLIKLLCSTFQESSQITSYVTYPESHFRYLVCEQLVLFTATSNTFTQYLFKLFSDN